MRLKVSLTLDRHLVAFTSVAMIDSRWPPIDTIMPVKHISPLTFDYIKELIGRMFDEGHVIDYFIDVRNKTGRIARLDECMNFS